jgi:hypothetical protein
MIIKKKKVKKLGRPKLRPYKALRGQAWDVFSQFVRQRDQGVCFTCGVKKDWKEQQAGHFIHRNSLDFDERAINCQCVKCNNYLSGNLVAYSLKMFEKYGKGTVEELIMLSNQPRKYQRWELEEFIAVYKEKLHQLGERG